MIAQKNRSLFGIGAFVLAMVLFPFLDVIAKFLGQQGVPPIEIVWSRLFVGVLATGAILAASEGRAALVPNNKWINLARGILVVLSTACFFWALKFQGIAETLSIFFVYPVVTTAVAPIVLDERVGIRRWLAVLVGLIGMMIILRPGFREVNPGMLLGALSGIATGFALIFSRMTSNSGSAMANTYYVSAFGILVATIAVAPVWQTPSLTEIGWLVLLGAIGTTGNYLTILASRYAEASLLAPIGYAEMINATFCGWYFFGDFPDALTFVGVAVLIACTTYISYRERSRAAESIADPGQV